MLSYFGDCDVAKFCPFSAETITTVSSRIKSTSPGPERDTYHSGYNKSCAVEHGSVVAKLLNFSLAQQITRAWKTANITPVSETSIVTGLGDLGPISVTSLLSRTIEKLL